MYVHMTSEDFLHSYNHPHFPISPENPSVTFIYTSLFCVLTSGLIFQTFQRRDPNNVQCDRKDRLGVCGQSWHQAVHRTSICEWHIQHLPLLPGGADEGDQTIFFLFFPSFAIIRLLWCKTNLPQQVFYFRVLNFGAYFVGMLTTSLLGIVFVSGNLSKWGSISWHKKELMVALRCKAQQAEVWRFNPRLLLSTSLNCPWARHSPLIPLDGSLRAILPPKRNRNH